MALAGRPRRPARRAALRALGGLLTGGAAAGIAGTAAAAEAYGDLREVELRGAFRPLLPILTGKYGTKAPEDASDPWALVTPPGAIYTLVDNRIYREARARYGSSQPVSVKARHFPRSMHLELLAITAVEAAAVKARFFCRVCNIYFEEFGPCVCCGLEVEPVASGGGGGAP